MAIEITQTEEFLDLNFLDPQVETLKLQTGIRIYEIGELMRFDYSYIIVAGLTRALVTLQYLAEDENSQQYLNAFFIGITSKDIVCYLRPDMEYEMKGFTPQQVTYGELKYAEYSSAHLIVNDPRIGRPILANKNLPPFHSSNISFQYDGLNPTTGIYEQTIINPVTPNISPSSFN